MSCYADHRATCLKIKKSFIFHTFGSSEISSDAISISTGVCQKHSPIAPYAVGADLCVCPDTQATVFRADT